MNRTNKLSWLLAALLFLSVEFAVAQTKEDLLAGTAEITWLGMDFTKTKFIGAATQFKDAGEITNAEFRDKYVTGWNQLFVNEQKKYDVAKVVHRTDVRYAMEVTEKTNNGIKRDFFSNNPDEYMTLDAAKVESLVKKYNYLGKTGIGLIFFIEGMSKGKDQASAWVAYVDMGKKTVLMSSHVTGKTGGFGFKNYWAKAFYNILKDSDYKDWK
ncbi:MAG: hypothetical protein H7258_01385 [Ferruginibacter sp.]|nr:hypothetical protein [Ferruginibacter sp.]